MEPPAVANTHPRAHGKKFFLIFFLRFTGTVWCCVRQRTGPRDRLRERRGAPCLKNQLPDLSSKHLDCF